MNDSIYRQQSEDDFFKARNKALFNDLQHFLNPEESKLLSFSEVKQLLKPKNEIYMGMQVVPISLIAGSEGRYRDFDNHFFPKSLHLKNRWESIDRAHLSDVILPPIVLYEIGGLYFVRDGNHRVSVARAQGVENIDAEVISLQSEIKLKPGMSQSRIKRQVIKYEKRVFYSETGFGDITDYWDIDFSSTGQYDEIYQHILIHKYYINQDKTDEISMEEAILSWFNNLYLPIVTVIQKQHILRKFKQRTPSDLYVWIIRYWDDLKHKFGDDVSIAEAAEEFTEKYGEGTAKRFINRIKGLFHKNLKGKKT
ncbi:MAG: transcriptional regulator [Treponema sp.]|nr:transcriptional regulator [Candidatus Treponema caballi]